MKTNEKSKVGTVYQGVIMFDFYLPQLGQKKQRERVAGTYMSPLE